MATYQTDPDEETLTIEVGASVALVLADLLHRWTGPDDIPDCFRIEHDAEYSALLAIQGALESRLVEPFLPDYAERIARARQRIVAQWGTWQAGS